MTGPAVVGNDIVDLSRVRVGCHSTREAFVARVCSASERAFVERSARPDVDLWLLWSAKETAFKVVQRLASGRPFRHRLFEVDPGGKTVSTPDHTVVVEWTLESDCLSCWGYLDQGLGPPLVLTSVARLSFGPEPCHRLSPRERASVHTRESLQVRLQAKRLIAQMGLDEGAVEVVRHRSETSHSGWSPPEVYYRGQPAPDIGVSLSHHGRFVGCAVARLESARGGRVI